MFSGIINIPIYDNRRVKNKMNQELCTGRNCNDIRHQFAKRTKDSMGWTRDLKGASNII